MPVFISNDKNMTQEDTADYVRSSIKDPIRQTNSVDEVQKLFGAQCVMRI
ncbi:hypothetical protein [Sodalis-like endosymbiont of Proechinophthirus fluctus]